MYQLPTKIQANTLKRFIESNPIYDELEELCLIDDQLKSMLAKTIIQLKFMDGLDDIEEHPQIVQIAEYQDEIKRKIKSIMRRQFTASHPIHQVFDNDNWSGKVLISSIHDFSDPSNWE